MATPLHVEVNMDVTALAERMQRAVAATGGGPRVVYLAHPIRGDITANIRRIREIERFIFTSMMPDIFPIAPYLACCEHVPDTDENRAEAFMVNERFFSRRLVDELWIVGDHLRSTGVQQEIRWALQHSITIRFQSFDYIFGALNE